MHKQEPGTHSGAGSKQVELKAVWGEHLST